MASPLLKKIKSNPKSIIIITIVVLLLIGFIVLMVLKFSNKKEGFADLINYEKFGSLDDLDSIKTDIQSIRSKLSSEYPDMSKYVQKAELPASSCRVATAVDKDSYVSKLEMAKQIKENASKIDTDKYVLKSEALKSQQPSSCPTLDPNQWILKSSLPPKEVCPPCIAPKVKVSAGLCKKCPPPPKCPEVKPCPVLECPKPQPCPPQRECPACPPKEACPPKICPACPPAPTQKECPKCCDRDVIKVLKKTVYLDQNGKEISSNEVVEQRSNNLKDKTGSPPSPSKPSSGSGLVTPAPTTGNTPHSAYTPAPTQYVQSYKVKAPGKGCSANAFNSEFKQYGVFGNDKVNMYNDYLELSSF
jgi:hypothetical protein